MSVQERINMAKMGSKTRKNTMRKRPKKKPTLPTVASKLKMLQADLLQAQQEINRLLERLADVNREKSEMVSNQVHVELLKIADNRAKRAEMRAMTLEQELRHLKMQYNNSHDNMIYPPEQLSSNQNDKPVKVLPNRLENPPMVPPRGGEYGGHPEGNRPRNASSPASPHMFRKNFENEMEVDRSRPTQRTKGKTAKDFMRSQSKSPKRNVLITTNMNRAYSQGGVDNKNKVTLASRVQSRMESKSPKSNHKTFLDRVQSKFFASKKKDAVTPCDLPDINTLLQYAVKAEYETPTEYMKNYSGTPLISHNNMMNKSVAESESDWSETDDEFLEPGIKKAKREKPQPKNRKQKDKLQKNDSDKSSKSKDGDTSNKEEESQDNRIKSEDGGSPRGSGKNSKPPPVAPKPKKSSVNNTSSSSLNSTGSQTKTNSTDATSQDKVESTESLDDIKMSPSPEEPSSPGREAPVSFDEVAPEKPQLKSYRRVQGPRGRRRPQRYSSQAMSQTMSTTLSQIMA